MIAGLSSIAAELLGSVTGGSKKSGTQSTASTQGFNITNLLSGSSDITDDGVNTSDSVSAGTQDALSMLKDMTSGGMDGYFKYMVKQLREKEMEKMGVSEADLAKMPPAQKDAIEAKIADAVKKEVAKIMGVDPETAQKSIEASDKGQAVAATTEAQAKKAYTENGTGSASEMLSQLLMS